MKRFLQTLQNVPEPFLWSVLGLSVLGLCTSSWAWFFEVTHGMDPTWSTGLFLTSAPSLLLSWFLILHQDTH